MKSTNGNSKEKRGAGTGEKKSETVKALLIALFAALVLRQFVIASYNVPTGSMKDTILIGDFMFVNKFIYGARSPIWFGIPFTDIGFETPHFRLPAIAEPERTDIIVFDYPKNIKQDYIKRCVAVGGQSVEVKDGILYLDDKPEGEFTPMGRKFDPDPNERLTVIYTHVDPYDDGNPYTIRHFMMNGPRRDRMARLTVPENHFFMMGDNRDNSLDSRSWGFVDRSQVVGKPLMIWLSWDGLVPGYRFYDKIRWERLGMVLR
ncbi:MAG: signal peptidase I [Calditrichaeota bacterium]|nr:signal peptidase I [Calditrichota bacterium]MCB0268153.1 signal peptidase I [Calditrichota bacterium]